MPSLCAFFLFVANVRILRLSSRVRSFCEFWLWDFYAYLLDIDLLLKVLAEARVAVSGCGERRALLCSRLCICQHVRVTHLTSSPCLLAKTEATPHVHIAWLDLWYLTYYVDNASCRKDPRLGARS
jgi:hypothetical protein